MGRRFAVLAVGVAIAVASGASLRAQSGAGEAGEAIEATLTVERTLLREDLAEYARIAARRNAALGQVQELHAALDAALQSQRPDALANVDELIGRLESAERERADQLQRERMLLDRLRERLRKIELLEEELAALEQRHRANVGPLEGEWTVVLLPSNHRGVLRISQTGTVVSGTYELEGGWSGSLQGTMVGRKVRVVRIDSRLGRSMELEGYLSADGEQLRGTWLSYDQSGGAPPHGDWSAKRRTADE